MNSKFFTILAIDDNQLSLVVLKTLLSEAFPKATFISALSGKEGIALFRAKKPDIVLLDIVMPEMDGYEVCTVLKSDPLLKHIPVVMLTAISVSGASRLKALESGADAFLTQPLDESELTVQIKTMIRLKESDERKHTEKERLEKQVRDRTKALEKELQERKKVEAALMESHQQLLDIIDFLPDATFVINNEKKVIAWNKAMEVMTGVQKQDMIGKGDNAYTIPFYGKKQNQLLDLINIDNEELKARYSNVSRNGLSLNAEIFAPALYDGKGANISVIGAPLFNSNGERIGSIESIRDITESKQSEKALQESEERFQLLFNKAPLGYQSLDFEGNFIEVNQQWLDTLGYTRSEVIGKWFGDFLSPAFQNGFRERFPIFKAEGKIHSEFEMVHKNGNKLFIAFEGKIGYDLNGEFKQTHCILQDITESKRAADALRVSEEKYRFMFANNPQPMWIYDLETLAFLEINEAAINHYGYSREEFLFMTLKDIHPPEDIPALLKDVELTRNAYNLAGEWRHFKKSGELIFVEITSHSVISNGRNARHVLINDITERKRTQEEINLLNVELEQRIKQRTLQLENINKELEAFSYSVSHDLRAPLRGIDGWSLALLEDYNHQLDDQGRVYLERVRNESQRMGHLIDDLLKLSRVTRNEMKHVKVDISVIAKTIVNRMLECHAVRQGEFIIQPGLVARGDPQMLEIALTNLFDNACKFSGTRAFAKIEFGLLYMDGVPAYYVRDNGVGFDMEYSKKLFGAFQRMHKHSEFPGTGIGLATVKRIISLHGGHIWAESKPNDGATFYFTIPNQ